MRIREILYQHRRDFKAVYECEGCGSIGEGKGYDDDYFHNEVIPDMRCTVCGKTGIECVGNYIPLAPLYPEGYQI